MKNKARPLSVERLKEEPEIMIMIKRLKRRIRRNRIIFGIPRRYDIYKKINQLYDDWN